VGGESGSVEAMTEHQELPNEEAAVIMGSTEDRTRDCTVPARRKAAVL
jgi:hypothetical protein